jgi:hypothetical protein
MLTLYERTLRRALQWPALVMLSPWRRWASPFYLFMIVP